MPYVTADEAPEPVAEALRMMPAQAGIVNLVAHAETCLRPFLRLGQAILTSLELDPGLRELAVLRAAQLCGVEYEWHQHERLARVVGVADDKIEALRGGAADSEVFTDLERRVLDFSTAVVLTGDADDATYAAVADDLSPREIVELTVSIGFYLMLGRIMNVTRVDPEPAAEVSIDDLKR
nr:carboxymuconolactone decarboxylase family protein [Streptomyces boncukensis]